MSAAPPGLTPERLHLGVAEQGKLYALEGDHRRALIHYREAMKMAVESGGREVFFRHYMECSLESLEHMGAHAELLEYADRAIAHYQSKPPAHDVARIDLATVWERRGIALVKMGRPEEARAAFERALHLAGPDHGRLVMAPTLSRWLATGLHVDAARVLVEQQHRKYFIVRSDNVRRDMAIPMPGDQPISPPAGR